MIDKENMDKINSMQNIELKRNNRDYKFNEILADALNLLWKEKKYLMAISDETLNSFDQTKKMYNVK